MSSTDEAWREWGKRDPYFAVITNPRFRQNAIDEDSVQVFFQSGQRHVEHLVAMVKRLLAEPRFAPARALDFGCGVGRITIPLARVSGEVVGVDISEDMLAEARRNSEREGVANARFVLSDDTLSQVEGTFDFVHSFIVLQHIDVPRGREFFRQLVERVNPGGIAALQVTYAKMEHADRDGRPPVPVPPPVPQAIVRSWWRRLTPLRQALAPAPSAVAGAPPDGDPQMQMNCYPLNDLLFIVQRAGASVAHLEFTDHGGELGVFIFLRKGTAPRP